MIIFISRVINHRFKSRHEYREHTKNTQNTHTHKTKKKNVNWYINYVHTKYLKLNEKHYVLINCQKPKINKQTNKKDENEKIELKLKPKYKINLVFIEHQPKKER